jgi:hypothetical protein
MPTCTHAPSIQRLIHSLLHPRQFPRLEQHHPLDQERHDIPDAQRLHELRAAKPPHEDLGDVGAEEGGKHEIGCQGVRAGECPVAVVEVDLAVVSGASGGG